MKTKLIFSATLALLLVQSVVGQKTGFEYVEKNTMEGKKLGVFSKKSNREILPTIYDNIMDYHDGWFIVANNMKVGIVDTNNKIIIPTIYEECTFIEDRIFVMKNKKWAMLNAVGVAMTGFLYDGVFGYEDGVARLMINRKMGYVDKFGKIILPFKFTSGEPCQNGYIINYTEEFVHSGYELVTTNNKGNVVNREAIGGHKNVPTVYNKQGKLVYKGVLGEKVTVTADDNLIVDPEYRIGKSNASKLIDKNGKVVIPSSLGYKFEGWSVDFLRIQVGENNQSLYGLMDYTGKIILKPNFPHLSYLEYENRKYARVCFDFYEKECFYIGRDAKCVEYNGAKCPE